MYSKTVYQIFRLPLTALQDDIEAAIREKAYGMVNSFNESDGYLVSMDSEVTVAKYNDVTATHIKVPVSYEATFFRPSVGISVTGDVGFVDPSIGANINMHNVVILVPKKILLATMQYDSATKQYMSKEHGANDVINKGTRLTVKINHIKTDDEKVYCIAEVERIHPLDSYLSPIQTDHEDGK